MRFKFAVIAPLLLIAAVVSAQTVSGPAIEIDKAYRTLSVSASSHAEADAEVAEIHIGFTAYGGTLPAAYKSASEKSNGIVKAVLDAGAQKSEIQSQTQNVSRLQDYEIKVQRGMRFSVQQSWTVRVAPKDAALILDAAIQAGANESGEIDWRMKESFALDAEAIRLATERAHAMAVEMAKSMGVKLLKPLYATNSINSAVAPQRMRGYAMLKANDSNQVAPLAIAAQRVESTANVEIIYAIE